MKKRKTFKEVRQLVSVDPMERKREWREKNNGIVVEDVEQLTAEGLKRFLKSHGIIVAGTKELCKWRARRFLQGKDVRINVLEHVRTFTFPRSEFPYDINYVKTQSGIEAVPYDLLANVVFTRMLYSDLINMMCVSKHMYNMVIRFLLIESKRQGVGTPMGMSFMFQDIHNIIPMVYRKFRYPDIHNMNNDSRLDNVKNIVGVYGSIEAARCVSECHEKNQRGVLAEKEYIRAFVDARLNIIHNYLDQIGCSLLRFKFIDTAKTHLTTKQSGANYAIEEIIGTKEFKNVMHGITDYIFMRRERILGNILLHIQSRPYLIHILSWKGLVSRFVDDAESILVDTVSRYLWMLTEYSEEIRIALIHSFLYKVYTIVKFNKNEEYLQFSLVWENKHTLDIRPRVSTMDFLEYSMIVSYKGELDNLSFWINNNI